MMQSRFGIVAGGAIFAASLFLGVSDVNAGWGSHGSHGSSGGSYGSYGSYGSSGGSYGSSGGSSGGYISHGSHGSWGSHGSHGSYGSHGSHGSFGGWFSRWHHHRRVRVYHSSGGSYGSHGSSGGSYGSSGGSYGSSGGTVIYSSPVQGGKYEAAPMEGGSVVPETPPAPPAGDQTSAAATEATLTVNVPGDAVVYVNGVQTKSVGSERSYVSRGLQRGFNYTYEVRAEVERDGEVVQETKMVSLTAGRAARLAFELAPSEVAPATTLTLQVPADAKVFLAGNETSSSGEVREFTTTKLATGQSWDNYTIRVTFDRDGQTITREKTITLTAGEKQVVSFENEGQLVASNN